MKKRILGNTGFEVSEIGLGCWQLGNDFGDLSDREANRILDTALDSGINFLDTADVYGAGLSERRIGNWLKTVSDKPFVVSKVGRDAQLYPNGYSREKVRANIEGSLSRLGVEALDLVQLHCVPPEVLFAGDLLSWMEDFQQAGLIRSFGASVEMIDEAMFCLKNPRLASLQILFNVFRQDAIDELLPAAADSDTGIIVRLPLASGLLSGKMRKDQLFEENDHRHYNKNGQMFHVGETFNGIPFETGVDLVEQLASEIDVDVDLSQFSLRWILDQPQVSTVIAGASRPQQVESNASASRLPALEKSVHENLKTFYNKTVRPHIRGGI